MYSLVRTLGIRTTLVTEIPYLLIALVIAEALYKWHSFTLELVGFLATWALLSFAGNSVIALLGDRNQSS